MRIAVSRPGFAPAAAGGAILLNLAAIRLLMTADAASVRDLGRTLEWRCALRSILGLPCPSCGVTRSVVLSVHLHLEEAWRVAPVGQVAVLGALLAALALIGLGCCQLRGWSARRSSLICRFQQVALVYAGLGAVVWIAGWSVALKEALRLR